MNLNIDFVSVKLLSTYNLIVMNVLLQIYIC